MFVCLLFQWLVKLLAKDINSLLASFSWILSFSCSLLFVLLIFRYGRLTSSSTAFAVIHVIWSCRLLSVMLKPFVSLVWKFAESNISNQKPKWNFQLEYCVVVKLQACNSWQKETLPLFFSRSLLKLFTFFVLEIAYAFELFNKTVALL